MRKTKGCFFGEDKWPDLSIKRRCELLGVARSSVYYKPKEPSREEKEREEQIKKCLDYWHTKSPCSGVRKLRQLLREHDDLIVGRKLIRRYINEMGIYVIYPKPNLSKPGREHKLPYLLKNMNIFLPNQVWAVDITYIPMKHGHLYLTAIIDWYSRFIVGKVARTIADLAGDEAVLWNMWPRRSSTGRWTANYGQKMRMMSQRTVP